MIENGPKADLGGEAILFQYRMATLCAGTIEPDGAFDTQPEPALGQESRRRLDGAERCSASPNLLLACLPSAAIHGWQALPGVPLITRWGMLSPPFRHCS